MAESGSPPIMCYIGEYKTQCGYCGSGSETSTAKGMQAFSMPTRDYQDLLERGWRRAGCWMYQPINDRCCCPQYTIRLNAQSIRLNKEQRRVLNKVDRFLRGDYDPFTSNNDGRQDGRKSEGRANRPRREHEDDDGIQNAVQASVESLSPSEDYTPHVQVGEPPKKAKRIHEGTFLSTPVAHPLAAAVRKKGGSEELGHPDVVAQKVAEKSNENLPSGISAYACCGFVNFARSRGMEGSSCARKSESGEVAQESTKSKEAKGERPPKKFEMEVETSWAEFREDEYQLWQEYQAKVHGDEEALLSRENFSTFLVETPLQHEAPEGSNSIGLGSFHQRYTVNGELLAVGVIDVLPDYLSSKYLFWNPSYARLSLGTYSAIQEAQLAAKLGLGYYSMGYYVPTCKKMRYKAQFTPSEILCPTTLRFVPFDQCERLLDQHAMELSRQEGEGEEAAGQEGMVERVSLLLPGLGQLRLPLLLAYARKARVEDAAEIVGRLQTKLAEWIRSVGPDVALRSFFVCPTEVSRLLRSV